MRQEVNAARRVRTQLGSTGASSLGRTPWHAASGERRLVVLILIVILQVVVVWRRKAGAAHTSHTRSLAHSFTSQGARTDGVVVLHPVIRREVIHHFSQRLLVFHRLWVALVDVLDAHPAVATPSLSPHAPRRALRLLPSSRDSLTTRQESQVSVTSARAQQRAPPKTADILWAVSQTRCPCPALVGPCARWSGEQCTAPRCGCSETGA